MAHKIIVKYRKKDYTQNNQKSIKKSKEVRAYTRALV